MRIVSLLPSTTEILFALGVGDDVVGVTFECDYPVEARQRRIVSTSTLPEGIDSASIDGIVSERLAAGEDLYRLDEDVLVGLDAELVVTQDLCAVCAVDVTEVEDALAHLGCDADVLTIDPRDLDEVLSSIITLGEATGTEDRADELVASLRARLEVVRGRVEARAPVRALVLEWTDPPFAPGHWVPDMVERAGGCSALGRVGERSFRTDWQQVVRSAPEVIVCAPCGYGLDDAAALTGSVIDAGVLPRTVPVWAVDANAAFARPGPRLLDGVEALAAILHSDAGVALDVDLARRVA